MLNPQYRKDIIPGDYRPYVLTLPTQQCLSYVMSEKRIADYDAQLYARRSYVEPSDGSVAVVEEPVSDNGVANLTRAASQSTNAEGNTQIASTQSTEKMVVKYHEVARGENLRDIARKYGVSATDIKRWNQLRRGKVKEGDKLKIEVYERVQPENVKIQAAAEVPQVSPKDLGNASAGNGKDVAEATASTSASQQNSSASKASANNQQTSKSRQQTSKPAPKAEQAKASKGTTHKIAQGETLAALSRKYGVSVEEIQAANGMKKSNTNIRAGETIKIPAKKSATSKSGTSKSSKKSKRRR